MEIIVLGAGAIGSFYGAKLAANNEVTLIGRAEHVTAINSHGLRIEGLESQMVRLNAATNVKQIGPDALIVLTTKVTDSDAALRPISSLIRADTTILCLQNGIGSERVARNALGHRGVVLRGITQFGAIFQGAGVIQFMARGSTLLEPHERSSTIAAILTAAGLDCRVSANIEADVWRKLVINCVVNAITAILGCEVGGIARAELEPLKRLVIDECVAVAAAEGIKLDVDFIAEIDNFFRPSRNLASMLQDLRRGRATEIDYLNGAVLDIGRRHGIACPVNGALAEVIKTMEATGVALRHD
jgi:2-dehydropantoate 2-reductase